MQTLQQTIDDATLSEVEQQFRDNAKQEQEQALSRLHDEWLDWYNHPYTKTVLNELRDKRAKLEADIESLATQCSTDAQLRTKALMYKVTGDQIREFNKSPLDSKSINANLK